MLNKKLYIFFGVISCFFLPSIVLAAEKSQFHIFYERTFGPIGAVAGIIAMVAIWQLSKRVDKTFATALKMFVAVLLFINIGSISFGVHGAGLLSGEASRYIERICRLVALLIADIVALKLFLALGKKQAPAPVGDQGNMPEKQE